MTCAIYCRLSREDDSGAAESESIQNQRELLTDYARQHNWEIYEVYCDDDYSGADPERPAWKRMLRAAKAGQFQIVLCKNLSRFTRDLGMVEKYIHGLFPHWGVRFITVLDHMDSDSRGDKKSRQINGLINEWYLEDLSDNVRAVLDQKRRQGKFIGNSPPYGYRKDSLDHNHLLVDPAAARIVQLIFRLYLQGSGIHHIAQLLNHQGIPSPSRYKQLGDRPGKDSSGSWSHSAISRILKNECYLGHTVQGRKQRESYKSKRLMIIPEKDWIRVKDTHEPVISQKVFDSAARRLREQTRSDGKGRQHLLAGKVRCMDCGNAMQRTSHRYKEHVNAYLQCRLYVRTRSNPQCTSHSIRLDVLENDVQQRALRSLQESLQPPLPQIQVSVGNMSDLRDLWKNINNLEQAMHTLYMDRAGGIISLKQFQRLNGTMSRDLQALTSQAALLEQESKRSFDSSEELKKILQPPVPAALLREMIDFIEIGQKEEDGHQEVCIHWNF